MPATRIVDRLAVMAHRTASRQRASTRFVDLEIIVPMVFRKSRFITKSLKIAARSAAPAQWVQRDPVRPFCFFLIKLVDKHRSEGYVSDHSQLQTFEIDWGERAVRISTAQDVSFIRRHVDLCRVSSALCSA